MSTRAIILISLLANLGLAAWAFHLHSRKVVSQSVAVEQGASSVDPVRANSLPPERQNISTVEHDASFAWAQVESADYKDYIARLRAIGCPEATIRDIIAADVNKLYLPRLRALMPAGAGLREYWKAQPSYYSKAERERQENMRALEKEKSALLVALLSVDPIKEKQRESGYVDYYERQLAFLPEEKRTLVRDIQEQYQRQMQKFYGGGFQDDEDRKQLKALREQQLAAVAQILTPEELKRYELTTSQVSTQLRYDLDGFKPTQEEFEKIFALRKAREDDLAPIYDGNDTAAQEKRRKATEEIDAQIKQTLGDQRFAEYKRAQDYSYKSLTRVLSRYELSEDLAVQLYDAKQAYDEQTKKLRADTSLDAAQRQAAMKELAAQANDHFKEQLGDRAYQSYKQQGGSWLNSYSR